MARVTRHRSVGSRGHYRPETEKNLIQQEKVLTSDAHERGAAALCLPLQSIFKCAAIPAETQKGGKEANFAKLQEKKTSKLQ